MGVRLIRLLSGKGYQIHRMFLYIQLQFQSVRGFHLVGESTYFIDSICFLAREIYLVPIRSPCQRESLTF